MNQKEAGETKQKTKVNYEERTLSYLRRNRTPLEVLLVTEQTVQCAIISYGHFTITVVDLQRPRELVLMKRAIVWMDVGLGISPERWGELRRPLPEDGG